jgi:hypothetical protein
MTKKKYLKPMAVVLDVSTATMLALSGNFIEGETHGEGVHPETPVDGENAWAKSSFDFEWE